jgi:kynurenine 3-monooxygenase
VHEIGAASVFLPYGQREHEVNYSIGRAALNRTLIEAAAAHPQVELRFGQACLAARPPYDALHLRDEAAAHAYEVALAPTIAADGAGSAVRTSLRDAGYLESREEPLEHDYKELTLPPVDGRHALEPDALHIWPRGGFMLIALPNTDGTFTATLFLARRGPASFEPLRTDADVRGFFEREFPDVVPLMPDLVREFHDHPQGQLATLYAEPWHHAGQVLLLGDAAHAIVPFHGQGMNAGFEDCVVLDGLLDRHDDWSRVFAEFERVRRPDTAAIARMALENYVEMRDTVRDPRFQRQKALSLALERRFPDRFIPRYSMVMFHPEIPYSEALRRGAVQAAILDALDDGSGSAATADGDHARSLIEAQLARVSAPARG